MLTTPVPHTSEPTTSFKMHNRISEDYNDENDRDLSGIFSRTLICTLCGWPKLLLSLDMRRLFEDFIPISEMVWGPKVKNVK